MPLIGFAEVLGGTLIAIPKTLVLGTVVILPVMIGLVVHNLSFDPGGILMLQFLY